MKVHGSQGLQTDDLLVTLCELQSGNRELIIVTVSTDASVLGTAATEPIAQHVPLVFSFGLLDDDEWPLPTTSLRSPYDAVVYVDDPTGPPYPPPFPEVAAYQARPAGLDSRQTTLKYSAQGPLQRAGQNPLS